jgi:hypothetical protein
VARGALRPRLWVTRLAEAHANGKPTDELTRLGRIPLIVADKVGYTPFEPEAANLFFQFISGRYERASVIVTSNKPFGHCGKVFGDDTVAAAMIDRLVHHAQLISLKADSYHMRGRDLGRVPAANTGNDQHQMTDRGHIHPSQPAHSSSVADTHQGDLAGGAEMSDDVSERSQPQSALDVAAAVGEQRPGLADRARDREAIDTEAAGKDVVSDTVPKVDQRGQVPVDEDQLVLRTRIHSPTTRTISLLGISSDLPHRPQLGHRISNHGRRKSVDATLLACSTRCFNPHHR